MTREELIVLIARVMEPDRLEITPGHEDCNICQDARDYILQRAKDALLAIEASGLAIVPVEATEGMLDAALDAAKAVSFDASSYLYSEIMEAAYSASLSANPLKP